MSEEQKTPKKYTFICSRGTLDGAYPALILGINACRLGHEVSLFFTFTGIDVIRKGKAKKLKFYPPGPMGAVPGMPQMATHMMKKMIDEAEVPNVEELLEMAQLEGVKIVACRMTMDMMKFTEEDLIEGALVWTAEDYLKLAENCTINMFT